MKISFVLSAVAVGLLSANAMAATVYKDGTTSLNIGGYVKGAHTFNEKDQKTGKDDSEFQIDVNGSQKLNDQFSLVGQYQGRVLTKEHGHTHRLHNRQAWVGFSADDIGTTLSIGRQTGVIYDVAGLSDMGVLGTGYSTPTDVGLNGRADGVVQVKSVNGPLTAIGQYKMSKQSDSFENGFAVNEGQAFGTAFILTDVAGTGLGGGAAYAHTEAGANGHSLAAAPASDVYSLAVDYIKGPVYVAATTVQGHNTQGRDKLYDNEVYANYAFDNGIAPELGYVATNAGTAHHEYVLTGATYTFNKNVSVGAGAGWDTTGSDDNLVKTYATYRF